MSETRTYKGTLTPTGKTLDHFMANEHPKWYIENNEGLMEYFYGEHYETHVLIDGYVYNVEKEDISYDSIFESTKRDDGKINFLVQYYNGACSFSEAIDYAMENSNE